MTMPDEVCPKYFLFAGHHKYAGHASLLAKQQHNNNNQQQSKM
jgi:hypothetical protein